MAEFNLFGAATKDSIRVGYIDPDRGYISSNSIYEANLYASKNPGAVFILETRDRIRYLSINEVNRLTPDDIKVDGGICPKGIKGLRPEETPTYGGGKHPVVINGEPVKVGARGGIPLTSGGKGGRPATAGGQYVTTGGIKVKAGGTGGNQIRLGGTGENLVFVGNDILSINGTEVRSGGTGGGTGGTGGTGGLPLTLGGTGGYEVFTDGTNECESKIYISGGGGVGAYAVPIIGTDGSVLAAIVTQGGYGYKTPPQARVIDTCKRGVGTVLTSVLGEIGKKEIVYDREEDFEIYDLTPPEGLVGYGKRFGPNGEDLGEWDPNLFASLSTDPIERQIRDYQDFLSEFKNPWWTTRKETPLEVIFRDKNNRVKHDVQHWAWGGKTSEVKNPPTKQDQFEDVKFKVFTQGGQDRNLGFNFVAEDGSHKFKFTADSFKDSEKETVTIKVKRNTVYKITSTGSFRGKGTEQGLIGGLGKDAKEIKGNKKGSVIFADFLESSNDNDDLQVEATQGKFTASNERKENGHTINDLTYKFESNKDFKPKTKKVIDEDSFMNRYAISPTPPSNIPGSDYAGRVAAFIWEEDFPYTGEYKFRGMADNIGKIFLDNELILEERKFRGDPTQVISKTIEAGVHEIKVELFNIPIKERPKAPGIVPVEFEVYGQGSNSNMAMNFVFTSKDDSFTINNVKNSKGTYKKTINVKPNVDYKVTSNIIGDKTHTSKTVDNKREFNIDFDGLNRANNPIEVLGKNLKLKDGDGGDTNARFTITSTSPGLDARFSDDGKKLVVKGDIGGDVTLKLNWDDNPRTNGVAVKSIKILGETWRQRGEKGEETKTIKLGKPKKELEKSTRVIEQGLSKIFGRGKKGTERGEGEGKIIFGDYIGSANDNDDMQIQCGSGSFTSSNKKFQTGTGGQGTKKRNTYDLSFRINAKAPELQGGSTQTQSYESIFNTADYINKADRKLWRTNVYGRSGFLSENGVCPFDTKKPLEDNPYAGRHVIRWENINFPNDGNYNITVDADDSVKIFIGNRDGAGKMGIGNGLGDIEKGGDEVIIENGMKKQTYVRFFKKGRYRIRTELTQTPGGRFSFDKNGKPGGADVTARFIERGNEKYLKVEGSGSAEIHFRLRTDDNPTISGVFASKIKIGKGSADSVELRRSRGSRGGFKEKEIITGSAFFESGREYLVQTFNSSSTTGSVIKNRGRTIEFDDDAANGFDENADLTISRISNQQKPKLKGVNPMALAIDIKSSSSEEARISPRTWYQNPMGAAFTIDAPLPPIPQEPKPQQEGRCPNNPLWTTRFSGGSESWWPVINTKFSSKTNTYVWSKFLNRFAISPLPPLSTPNSDGGGGIVYSNTWNVDFPDTGFYGFKGSCDDKGRILVDGQEVYRLRGRLDTSPEIIKKEIEKGNHKVTVEVENLDFRKRKKVTREIFNTQNWQKPLKEGPPTPAELVVEYRGLNQGSTKTVSGEKSYAIRTEGASRTAGRRVVDNGREIQFDDDIDDGFDENASLKIQSTSPGVTAKFNGDGTQMIVKGSGDVSLKFKWDDNPSTSGLAVGTLKVGNGEQVSWTSRQRGGKGSEEKTIKVDNNDTQEVIGKGGLTVRGNDVKMKDGHGDDINSTFSIVSSTVDAKFSSDGKKINYKGSGEITLRLKWDDNPKTYGKAVDSIAVGGKVWNQKGEKNSKTQTIKVTAESSATGGIQSGKQIGGVTYSGPVLFNHKNKNWSDFMNKSSISPYLPPLDFDNPNIVGKSNYIWSGVKFPENGQYVISFQADDIAKLFINGVEITEVRSFRGESELKFVELSGGTYDIEVELTNIQLPKDIFLRNPSGFALKITKDITIVSSESPAWKKNPVGASAIIIPPPCKKEVVGAHFVDKIIVQEPGNGHSYTPPLPGDPGGTPVTLILIDIVPTSTGIGYTSGDRIILDTPGRPPIEFIPTINDFGQITTITPPRTPEIPPDGPSSVPPVSPPPDPGDPGDPGDPDSPGLGFGGLDGGSTPPTEILQVTDLPGDIGIADDTGVLIPLIPSGGASGTTINGTGIPAPGPFYGFTEYPNIYPISNTGLGFRGRPVFEVVIIPDNILPDESVLQVVDIPGLRKTGYVNGKPYYGQVFAKDGNLYAGISQTIGQLVPVYATLQESILNLQTTQPSAILRSGSETNSNNPNLNLPNTPDNLI